MGKIIAAEYLALDGVMESPGWTGPFFDDDVAAFQWKALFGCEALLLGRVTYEGFKEAWPSMNEDDFGKRINSMPKYVATASLTEPEWNATFLSGDLLAEVAKLKEGTDNYLIYGSAKLSESLRSAGLIDEYRIMLTPVVVGSGLRLFGENSTPSNFTLAESSIAKSGMALLTYQLA